MDVSAQDYAETIRAEIRTLEDVLYGDEEALAFLTDKGLYDAKYNDADGLTSICGYLNVAADAVIYRKGDEGNTIAEVIRVVNGVACRIIRDSREDEDVVISVSLGDDSATLSVWVQLVAWSLDELADGKSECGSDKVLSPTTKGE